MELVTSTRMRRGTRGRVAAAIAALGLLAGVAGAVPVGRADASESRAAAAAQPTVTGPITGGAKGRPFGTATAVDLAAYGYVEEEYFFSGNATTYSPSPGTTLAADGAWSVQRGPTAPFKSRMLIRRPTDPAKFNGTVLVLWLNASAGFEIGDFGDPQLLERGYAQVFVSAQRDGLEGISLTGPSPLPGLRTWDPQRYDSLDISSNDLAFDVFSQAGMAVGPNRPRTGVDPLPGLDVRRLVAWGGSQSAAWLLTYYNAVQPLEKVFQGFVPILHFGSGRPLATGITMPSVLRFRTDEPTPVLVANSEGEVESYSAARQADSDRFRYWEYAGTNHTGGAPGQERLVEYSMRDFGFPFPAPTCGLPLTTLDTRYTLPSAAVAMHDWLTSDKRPAIAPRMEVVDGKLVRDLTGAGLGGIRIPQVAVPTSTHGAPNGDRVTNLQCFLQGWERPHDISEVSQAYPTRASYLSAIDAAADELLAHGYILPEDVARERALAAASGVGDLGYWVADRDGGVHAFGDAPFLGSAAPLRLDAPVVGMAATPTGRGYWLVTSKGGVYTFGDATFAGSAASLRLDAPVVGISPTPSGRGYWLVTSKGGIYTFGDARFSGSAAGQRLNGPVVAMAPTPAGDGYWLLGADGGVFTFGTARFLGAGEASAAIVPSTSGNGYALIAHNGGTRRFGDSTMASAPVEPISDLAAVAPTANAAGYWSLEEDGKVGIAGNAAGTASLAGRTSSPAAAIARMPMP